MFDSVLHRPMKCCCENYQIMLNRLKLKTKGLHTYDVHKKKRFCESATYHICKNEQ